MHQYKGSPTTRRIWLSININGTVSIKPLYLCIKFSFCEVSLVSAEPNVTRRWLSSLTTGTQTWQCGVYVSLIRLSHLLHGGNCVPTVAHFGLKSRRPRRRQILVRQDHEVRNAQSLGHFLSSETRPTVTEEKREPGLRARTQMDKKKMFTSPLFSRSPYFPVNCGKSCRSAFKRKTSRPDRLHFHTNECARVEVSPARYCAPSEGGSKLHHHVGMFALSTEKGECVSFISTSLISMQTSDSSPWICTVPHWHTEERNFNARDDFVS